MAALVADLAYGLRLLRNSRGFALITIGTLALGIGVTTAMFSVVDGVLLKPFPVKDQGRLLIVWTSIPKQGFDHWPFSYASYEGMRERLHTASGVAAHPYSGALPTVLHLDDGSAMPLQHAAVTGEWFDVLGVRARAGRFLTAADDQVGAPDVVVLSSSLAERVFDNVAGAIGRRVRLQDTTFTVVGVAPAAFDYPRGTAAWVPAVRSRDSPYMAWDLAVRVAPGFTIEQTVSDLTAALAALPSETGPLGDMGASQVIHAQPFADAVVGDVRPALLMLGAGVLLMLTVAGVNVANLLIARGLARRRELSIRAAIGASRMRLVRLLAAEAFVLASCGTMLAIVVALAGLEALIVLAPAELPRLAEIGIDRRALAFTAGIAMLATVLFGVLPAVHAARVEPADALRGPDGSAAPGGRRYWLRHALVVGQIAITMVVLSTAGLLLRSLDRMHGLKVGFASEGLFLAEVALPPSRYVEPVDLQRAMVRLAEQAATLPGIGHASAVTMAPFAGTQGVDANVFAEGQPFDESVNPLVNYEGVDASYFATLGLPIIRGRAIDGRDRPGSEPAVVVNETFARLFWPGHDPIGRRIKWGSSTSTSPWLTVVGLAADARYRELTTVRPGMYVSYSHGIPVSPGYLAIRSSSAPLVAAAVRRAIVEQEPGATVVRIEALPHLLAAPLARPRFQSMLAACFASVALLLSMVGTYGMLSFLVRQRRREIGIRMALGASPSNVRRRVLRHGLTIGVAGTLLGTALALAIGRLVQPLLFGVTSSDPRILIGTAASLLIAVAAATLVADAHGDAHRSAAGASQRVERTTTMQPVRQAIRVIRNHPGFGALVVLILAAGIGATTAALNVAASVLLTPLPVTDDSRLVLITKRLPTGSTEVPFTPAEMTAWGDGTRTFEAIGGVQYDGAWPWPAELGDRALTVTGTVVSGNFFEVLGARPAAGRLLVAADALAGSEEVAVIGYGLWRRQFGGDPGVAGRKIRLNGRAATIVGVAPPGFTIPKGADVWQPLVNTRDALNEGWFKLVARLKSGATLDQAVEESTALLDRFRAISPRQSPPDMRTAVVPLKETIVGGLRPVLALFVAAAVLLFLVGCLNVMTLLLVRGTTRERELAVCSALGATRSRLITQLMAEAAILATAGGAAGALVAFWLQRLLLAAAPAGVPRLDQVGFDGLTLGLAVAASLAGVLLAGVTPAILIVPRHLFSGLRGSPGNTRRQIGGQMLVAAQLAFALLVTIGAALLVRSLHQLQSVDLGFSIERLHVVQVPLVGRTYGEPERRRQLFDALVSRLETLPGIAAATPVLLRPFTGAHGWDATFTREGQGGQEASANPGLHLESVWPDYFSTIGAPILRGRAFTESDRKGGVAVAIVSESLARHGWPSSPAVGQRIKFGPPGSAPPWMTVIGVVGDMRYRDLKAPPPAIYVPAAQTTFPARFLLVRASVDAAPVLAMTERALRDIDPGEPVPEAAPIAALLDGELAAPRFYMFALSLFAAVAVLLAGVGVFGVLGAFVAQRSAEVGLRVALGATVADIRRLVLSRIGWPAILGLTAGTGAAVAAAPQLGPLLFQVSARDALAFAAGWVVLALVSLAAATIPLRRACRVDPVTLLRHEG